MFKSLALIATVALADITLVGTQDEKTIAGFVLDNSGSVDTVTCASKSGYKLNTADVTAWAQNTGSFTTTRAQTAADDLFDTPKTPFNNQGWYLNVALQGAISTNGSAFNMHMLNNAASAQAYYAEQTVLTDANMAEVAPVAIDHGYDVTGGAGSNKGTVQAAADAGKWTVVKAKSLSTVAASTKKVASMTLTIEKIIKTDFAKWSRKEKMTMGCGGAFTAVSAIKKGKVDTSEWEFGVAGAVATMAGASVVAAAALLF